MNKELSDAFGQAKPSGKHPAADSIEDVITFKLQLLVSIGERAGQDWSQRLFDLSLNEWRMLALVRSRGPCRAGDISDLLHMDKSQTSRVMRVLLKRELIVSRPDPNDGRALSLELTPAGEVLHDRVFREVMNSNERVLATLTRDEVEAFYKTLKKLVTHSQDLLEIRLDRKVVR